MLTSIPVILFCIIFIIEIPAIPTSSMFPTIKPGEMFIAKKYEYGYSTYSFTHLNMLIRAITQNDPKLFNYTWYRSDPQAGDIIQFAFIPESSIRSYYQNQKTRVQLYYCKRVIGVPGDTISVINNQITINNIALDRELIEKDVTWFDTEGNPFVADLYQETLNDKQYHTILNPNHAYIPNIYDLVLGDDEYFCMGDNRTNSQDSRFFGPVKRQQITGQINLRIGDFVTPLHKYIYQYSPSNMLTYLLVNPILWIILALYLSRRYRYIALFVIISFILWRIITTCQFII